MASHAHKTHTFHTHVFLKEVGGGRRGKNSTWVWKRQKIRNREKKKDGEVQETYASFKKKQSKTIRLDQSTYFEEKEV